MKERTVNKNIASRYNWASRFWEKNIVIILIPAKTFIIFAAELKFKYYNNESSDYPVQSNKRQYREESKEPLKVDQRDQ